MTLTEIAQRISEHLKRFERDPEINPSRTYDTALKQWVPDKNGVREYYGAHAYVSGRYARVMYVSYQGATSLTKDEALKYLAWLDSGKVGRHFEALWEKKP